jgi:hypothetical protein
MNAQNSRAASTHWGIVCAVVACLGTSAASVAVSAVEKADTKSVGIKFVLIPAGSFVMVFGKV